MRYIITAIVAFIIGCFVGDYRECGTPCERLVRGNAPVDASLEFRQNDIALHVGDDVIVLPDEIAAAIAMDINNHLQEK